MLASVGVFAALVCLWATYFGGGEDLVSEHVSTTGDPIRAVRLLMNATYGVLAGLVALAVGSELAIAHPLDRDTTIGPLLFGGPALCLAAQAWYFRVVTRRAWAERFVASVGLAIAGAIAIWLPAIASVAILVGILTALVVILLRVHRRLTGSPAAAAPLESRGLPG